MFALAMTLVLESVFGLFILAALVRFYAQVFRAPFRNPIGEFVMALTDFMVKPLRRVVPALMGLDTASMLVAAIGELVLVLILSALAGVESFSAKGFWSAAMALSMVRLLKYSLYLLVAVVVVDALLSIFSPFHPLRSFFSALTKPFLQPLRRIIPLVGNVDLSPWLLLLIVQVLLIVPVAGLEAIVGQPLPRLVVR